MHSSYLHGFLDKKLSKYSISCNTYSYSTCVDDRHDIGNNIFSHVLSFSFQAMQFYKRKQHFKLDLCLLVLLNCLESSKYNLHNYFNLHICPSIRRRRRHVTSRHTFKLPIPAVDSQNVSNESCLACAQSEKYSFGFTLRPLGSWGKVKLSYIHHNIRQDETKLLISKLNSVFHHLSSVGPKLLCALAHLGCTREAGTS